MLSQQGFANSLAKYVPLAANSMGHVFRKIFQGEFWRFSFESHLETLLNDNSRVEIYPIGSIYGIFTYIYHTNLINVGKDTIHGWYGYVYINGDYLTIVHIVKTGGCIANGPGFLLGLQE